MEEKVREISNEGKQPHQPRQPQYYGGRYEPLYYGGRYEGQYGGRQPYYSGSHYYGGSYRGQDINMSAEVTLSSVSSDTHHTPYTTSSTNATLISPELASKQAAGNNGGHHVDDAD